MTNDAADGSTPLRRVRARVRSLVRSRWLYLGIAMLGVGFALGAWAYFRWPLGAPVALLYLISILVVAPVFAAIGVLIDFLHDLTGSWGRRTVSWQIELRVPSSAERAVESAVDTFLWLAAMLLALALVIAVLGGVAGLLLIGWRALAV
jgi:hypothetical protein